MIESTGEQDAEKEVEVAGGLRKFHKKELYNLHSSPSIA
jgi:hypothetical protein